MRKRAMDLYNVQQSGDADDEDDVLDEEGLVLLAHSLQALEASPAGRLRLGVLLNLSASGADAQGSIVQAGGIESIV